MLRTLVLSALTALLLFLWRRLMRRGYQLYSLSRESRDRLLDAFPPKYSEVRADHITYKFDVRRIVPLPPLPRFVEVVGYSFDESIECVVVKVDGLLHRPDGKLFHITISFDESREAKDSNDLLAERGWMPIIDQVPLLAFPDFRAF